MKYKMNLNNIHIIIIILGTIFISLSIFHSNLWFDESYSVGMANHNLIDIWNIGGHDVHPVLYYWMLRIINLLTNGSILAYRLFSAIPIALLGLIGYTHIRKDFGEKTGIIFSFLCYFLPIMAVYANQIRMYSWAIYIVTILAIYAYRIYLGQSTKKNWIIFGISSLASIFIHYYGLITAGLINVFLLIHFTKNKDWNNLKWLIGFGFVQIIAYIPWIIYLVSQIEHVSKGFWIGFTFPDTIFELIGCQMNGTANSTLALSIGFIANILLFIYLIITVYNKRKDKTNDFKPVKYAVILYLAVIISALIITALLKSSVLYYRYLFVITGLYIFAVSYILAKSDNKYIIILICIIIITLGIYNNINQIKINYSEDNKKPIEYLKQNLKEDDILVYNEVGSGFTCASIFKENKQFFYNKENFGVKEAYKVWAPQMETYITTDFLENCTGRIWIIGYLNNSCYEELFNNDNYTTIEYKYFKTQYQNYTYNITLVEKDK